MLTEIRRKRAASSHAHSAKPNVRKARAPAGKKKKHKDGTVKVYGRCAACNVWNGRMDQVLKRGPSRNQWNSFTLEQKKTFRDENKDKFSDDLAIALTTAYDRVVL